MRGGERETARMVRGERKQRREMKIVTVGEQFLEAVTLNIGLFFDQVKLISFRYCFQSLKLNKGNLVRQSKNMTVRLGLV